MSLRVLLMSVILQLTCFSYGAAQNDLPNTGEEKAIMNLQELDQFLSGTFPGIQKELGQGTGQWTFQIRGREVMVVADEAPNRIRAMSPVRQVDPRDSQFLFRLLEANFGRALDARYAITRDVLWSLFLHPLRDCRPGQLKEGIRQVVSLADNTGTSFASSELVFGEG